MGLETGNLIGDLNQAWPLGTDDVSQGDDHIRLIKKVLENNIVGNTAPMQFTGTDFHIIDADIYTRDLNVGRNASVTGTIAKNPQVAIALGHFDGTGLPSMTGSFFGVVSIARTGIGQYEVTLTESPDADAVGAGSAFYGLVGGFLVSVYPSAADVVVVQVRDPSQNLNPFIDADNVNFVVFDSGRG
jgi:hypothetical protein